MPPKPAHRRSARVSSREPEDSINERPGRLTQPRLPPLQGTPSSRKQYSYGAAPEPPSRPSGLHRIDLDNAVSEALARRPEDLDEGFVRPPRPQKPSDAKDTDEDELAREPKMNGKTGSAKPIKGATQSNLTRSPGSLAQQSMAGSDADSLRSFGMESDFYDDATIVSADEGSSRAPLTQLRTLPVDVLPEVTPQVSQRRNYADPALRSRYEPRRPVKSFQPTSQPLRPDPKARVPAETTVENEDDSQEEEEGEEEEEDEEELEEPVQRATGNGRTVNTPAIRRTGPRGSREPDTRGGLRNEPEVGNPPGSRSRSPEAINAHVARVQTISTTKTVPEPVRLRLIGARAQEQPARQPSVDRAQPQTQQTARQSSVGRTQPQPQSQPARQSSVGRTQPQDTRKTLNLSGPSRGLFAPATESRRLPRLGEQFFGEQDQEAAIQRQIQEAEDLEARQREMERLRRVWPRRWAWFLSLFSLDPLRAQLRDQRPARRQHGVIEEDELEQVEEPTNWLRLMNPLFYLRALVYIFDRIMDFVVDSFDKASPSHLRGVIPRPGKTFRWVCLSLLALITGIGLLSLLSRLPLPSMSYRPSAPGISFPGVPSFSGVTDKLKNFVPSSPWSSDYDYDSLWELDDEDRQTGRFDKQFKQQFEMIKKTQRVHQDSLDQIQKAMPKLVHMDVQNGKPVIPQDLWHAIRDQVYSDGNILTMEQKDGHYQLSSEDQFQALVARLANDPAFSSRLNISSYDFDHQLSAKLPSFLESWISNNNDKVTEWLGPAVERIPSSGSDRDFTNQISKLIKERLKGDDLKGIVVTREEFMQHVKSESAAIKKEFRAELEALEPKLKTFIHDAVKLATKDSPQGMSKSDVNSLVHNLIRKAFADMNLEAMANGRIHLHWDAELKNQINFFSMGGGATIDGHRSSPIYDPHNKGSITDQDYRKGLRASDAGTVPNPPIAALAHWTDEGDCYCAAHEINRRGNFKGATLSVQLSQPITPQHIVIEHILPGATADPGARPKDIEIYAAFEADMHDRAADFASTHFPDNEYWAFNPPEYDIEDSKEDIKFFKIGRLVYKDAELHDGVHVHRLSSELAELGVVTDHIIIRATSNYGAEGHTCFYRVRVYGVPSQPDLSNPE